jgi:hypothetical protein
MAPPGGIAFSSLTGDKGYEPRTFYGQSKLANGLVARELARRLLRLRGGGPAGDHYGRSPRAW